MKKIINISIILTMLVTICMLVTTVYATSSATIQLNTDYNAEDDVVVEAKLSNLITDRGVIALGAVLEYDKDVLEFKEIAGQNGWVASNSSYNPESGKIITDRNAPGTTDEVVFTITFKVKNMNANSASITLKEIEIGDGGSNGVTNLNSVTKTITIKEIDTSNTNQNLNLSTTTESSESGNGNQLANSDENNVLNQKKDQHNVLNKNKDQANGQNNIENKVTINNKLANGKLPKTGKSNIITIVVLATIVIIVIGRVCYIKLYKKKHQ